MAESINDKKQIVGTAYDSDLNDSHPFIWPNSNSPGIDLNMLIPSDSGWELAIAKTVNIRVNSRDSRADGASTAYGGDAG